MHDLKRLTHPRLALSLSACLSLGLAACTDDGGGDDEVGEAGTDTAGTSDSGTSDGTESGTSADTTGDGDTDTTTTTTTETGDGDTGTTDTTGDGDTGTTDTTGDGDTGTTDTTGDGDTGTTDTTGDGDTGTDTTDTGPDPLDADMDGIPDPDDPFPMDPDLPGKAEANVVYAHTSSTLFTMDPFTYDIVQIGGFSFDQSQGSVTDIAIDRWGVLYAVTFNDVFVCNPNTAECYYLGDLPSSFNGLTMVPPGTIDPNDDTLIGIANSGSWYQVEVVNQQAVLTQLGSYGAGYSSSGDVFSIDGTGTFGAVNKQGVGSDVIVDCDPTDGTVLSEISTLMGYSSVFGLAGWEGTIFAFNSGGEVIEVDPMGGMYTVVADTPHSWWGAGVYTVLPQ